MIATGRQVDLVLGDWTATVTELAAGLRLLAHGDVHLTQTYPADRLPPWACGIVLAPWPNRVRDGLWHLDGAPQQLDITEPKTGNASHGLLRNTGYRVAERDASSTRLEAGVFPQHGWPFRLDTSVTYTLTGDALRVEHGVTNLSDAPAPYAVGAHPYLTISDVPTEELELLVRAATRIETDAASIPVGRHPVDGTASDLRGGVRLGDVSLDACFTDLTLLDSSAAQLRAPDGRLVELVQDAGWDYLQVFTQPAFPTPDGDVLAVALEPMTAPADALNSGDGLRWLEPGESWSGGWGIRYTAS
jgi:aldose 1-epimerase